jgi:hypothetical protein
MSCLADLHTHTTASDGQYTPAQLVRLAKDHGLSVLAVTDHDTIAGMDEAIAAGETLGLRVIRGVELSAKEHHNFHILGYGFKPGDTALAQLCEKLRAGRDDRKYKIVDFLREKGLDIDLTEVEALAGGKIIARPHFAQVLVKHGYASTNREAFDRYLDTEEFRQKVKRFKADARTCVRAIKSAGGKVSLAHPYQMGLPDDELDDLVRQLKGWGLDAIECYYPKYTSEQQHFYIHLAEKYHLHQTGGSDFHGEKVKPDVKLAALELDTDWLAFQ